jgi:hypothetical protein
LVAESVKLSVALRAPVAVGLNVTEALQLVEAARLAPQVLLAIAKSAALVPEIAMSLIVIDEVSPFDSVADCDALVDPTDVLVNVRLDGVAETLPDPPVPSPVSVTLCGLFVAESLNSRIAERLSDVVGAKTTLAVQVEDAASEAPHVLLLIRKSPGFVPDVAMLLMEIELVPLFVSVTVFGAPLLPTATDAQLRLVGETEALPDPVAPVPDSATDCGLLLALSVKFRVAFLAPVAPGLKVTEAAQFDEAARLLPQVLLVIEKSPAFVPEIAMLLIVIDEASPLVKVADFAALVEPVVTLPNASDVGLTETVPLVEVPKPVSATVCGLPLPESLKFNIALREPATVGEKVTFTVQLEDAASDEPQILLNILKSVAFEPVIVMLLIVIAAVFVFERVTTFCAPVFPTATEAQLTVEGDGVTDAMQFTPVNAQRAITPLAAMVRHRPMKNGAEVVSKEALRAQGNKLNRTRLFMKPPGQETRKPDQECRLRNQHRERLLRLVVRKG